MRIHVFQTAREMGADAASLIAEKVREAIRRQGQARLLLSTGASQFELLNALVHEEVAWERVTMFHLDEYIGLSKTHIASFRKYLEERFTAHVPLREAVYVNGEGDVQAEIAELTRRLSEAPIDVAAIGIGENGHVAFNDPPADFETQASYLVVNLDDRCKAQQVREGWFETLDDVPKQALSMTVSQMLKAKCIVSVVPHGVKAEAVKNTLYTPVSNLVPATILKTHPDWHLYLDADSSRVVW